MGGCVRENLCVRVPHRYSFITHCVPIRDHSPCIRYALFLLISSGVLIFIVNVERLSSLFQCKCRRGSRLVRLLDTRNFGWYMVWGWAAFLLPLLKVASISLGDDMETLFSRLVTTLFSAEEWPNTICEFVLSDVIVSDLLYLTISDAVQLQLNA